MTLDPVEARVLGVLAEKSLATPDYYPLSLAALVTGCNQKTNREPVMELSESDAAQALARAHPPGPRRHVGRRREPGGEVPPRARREAGPR